MQRKGSIGLIIAVIAAVIIVALAIILSYSSDSTMKVQNVDLKKLTVEEAQSKIIDSNQIIHAYDIDLILNASISMNFFNTPIQFSSSTTMRGYIDNTKREADMKGTMITSSNYDASAYISDESGNPESGAVNNISSYEIMVKDGKITTIIDGVRNVSDMTDKEWSNNDLHSLFTDMVRNSSYEFLPDEKVNGNDCYVLNLHPSIDKLINASANPAELDQNKLTQEDISKYYSVKIWVDKNNLIVKRGYLLVNMTENGQGFTSLIDAKFSNLK